MPSLTPSYALIKLYHLGEHPWSWPTWQDITGIRHGLFPQDDRYLPGGWNRRDADDVQSFFRHCEQKHTEDEKIKFARDSLLPGRALWTTFVSKSWNKWDVHSKIVGGFRKHGVHPITLMEQEGSLDSWPDASAYIPIALDTIALSLFGVEAFNDTDILPYSLRRCLTIFIQRSWARIRVQVNKDKLRFPGIEQAALDAFKNLSSESVTKKDIIATIRSVAKWRDIAEIYGTPENISKADDMLAELYRLMKGLGVRIPKGNVKPKKCLFKSTGNLQHVAATKGDLAELSGIYREYFSTQYDDVQSILNEPPSVTFRDTESGDLGMEVEGVMDPDTLALSLGFAMQKLPYNFQTYRHKAGITAWEHSQAFLDKASPDLLLASLHWHQLAGVHSIVRNVFTENPTVGHCTGMLICDEVGLGKTALAIATMSFLNQAIELRASKHPLPPILQRYKYLQEQDTIESLPHLIIVPGTLRSQWVQELKTLLHPRSVDIFVYDCPKKEFSDCWSPTGSLNKSQHKPHNRIIIMTHATLQNEMGKVYHSRVGRGKRPWELPDTKRSTEGTVFQQRFLSVTIDEMHELRNPGMKHCAGLRIFQQGIVKLGLTGTPLLTSPRDIAAMARLIGVPYFLTEASVEDEKDDASIMRRAKKMDDDGLQLRLSQVEAVRRMQKQFGGNVLRRTTDSHNWKGHTLLNIPPHEDIIGVLELTEREKRIMDERAKAAKESVISANESDKVLTTQKFYLEYRVAVCYAKEDTHAPNPVFGSLEEWRPVRSTKMDVCAKICAYYLHRDDVPDVKFENGKPVFHPLTKGAGEASRKRKILIYAEFPSMTGLLRNVLKLYRVDSLAIDGHLPYQKRDEIVTRFHSPDSPRVLIFSRVGSAGLNLSIADRVILFDQPWSGQDERQIRGRAHRQPQKSIVKVIHLLASDSSDILMNNMARGKKDMFDAFVNKELGQELKDLLSGKAIDNGEDVIVEEVDEVTSMAKKRGRTTRQSKGKGKAKERKSKEQAEPCNEDETPMIDPDNDASGSDRPASGWNSDASMLSMDSSQGGETSFISDLLKTPESTTNRATVGSSPTILKGIPPPMTTSDSSPLQYPTSSSEEGLNSPSPKRHRSQPQAINARTEFDSSRRRQNPAPPAKTSRPNPFSCAAPSASLPASTSAPISQQGPLPETRTRGEKPNAFARHTPQNPTHRQRPNSRPTTQEQPAGQHASASGPVPPHRQITHLDDTELSPAKVSSLMNFSKKRRGPK